MNNLDFSVYNWELFRSFVLSGLAFSAQLTVIAMIGGILIGTVVALMRASTSTACVPSRW
jgi:glutamate/aspartate transport system permease protein